MSFLQRTMTSFVRRSGTTHAPPAHDDEDDFERDADAERQPKPQFNSERFRRMELMIEFMNLRNPRHCPSGVYVMPSENFYVWFGVLFVHKGYYKNGVFKFRLNIPNDYPERPPTVTFINHDDLFHPLIDPNHGNFSLAPQFKDWAPHKYFIFHVLHYIKKAFKKQVLDSLVERHCPNKKAFQTYRDEVYKFAILAKQCANLSVSETKLYENHIESNPIRFEKMDDSLYEELKATYFTPPTPDRERPSFSSRRSFSMS